MKKFVIPVVILLLVILILFFPVKKTHRISGTGEVLTMEKVKTGECSLSVAITEIRSFVITYDKTFTFVLNGEHISEFNYANDFSDDVIYLQTITQPYYDVDKNQMSWCTLLYHQDLSYAVIHWKDNLYFLPNGTEMTYAEIPWQ